MTKEELIQLIKEGKASLLDVHGKDVSKDLENPEEKEEKMETKVDFSKLSHLLKNENQND